MKSECGRDLIIKLYLSLYRMAEQIITMNINPSNEEKIASNGFRPCMREPLCMVRFTPTPEQIKIWNEKYKDLYCRVRR
jgi:hypothetical protein